MFLQKGYKKEKIYIKRKIHQRKKLYSYYSTFSLTKNDYLLSMHLAINKNRLIF